MMTRRSAYTLIIASCIVGFAFILIHSPKAQSGKPESANAQWSIPTCNGSTSGKKRVGSLLRIVVPKGTVLKKSHDVDYSEYFIGYGASKTRMWLTGIWGPNAASGHPPWEIGDGIHPKIVSERAWKSGMLEGVDVRGRSADGKYWRYVGIFGESIKYEDVSEEAANFFDKVIDDVCISGER